MAPKLSALGRSPSGAGTAVTTKATKGGSSRRSRSERGLGRGASPYARPEARRTGQQRRARPSWAEELVPPPPVSSRMGSNHCSKLTLHQLMTLALLIYSSHDKVTVAHLDSPR